jgi:DUF2924 family protein
MRGESSDVWCRWGHKSPAARRTAHGLEDRYSRRESRREAGMSRRAPVMCREALCTEIADLSKADIKDLRERCKVLYAKEPSAHIGRSFLVRAVAYRLQEKAFGGVKLSTGRLLARVAEETANEISPKKPRSRKAGTGTMLVREWQGNVHRVTMLDDGVSFNGKRYRSLSEVAREITGSRWSGPRFFGLRLPSMENNHGTL